MNFFKKTLACIAIFSFFISHAVWAAEISIQAKSSDVTLESEFKVDIFLNTNKEKINAIEGTILFPKDLLELKSVQNANSVINFWIEKPKSTQDNKIVFSGITPGGYSGEKGLLFSLVFLSKKKGVDTVKLLEATTLLNDGNGLPAKLTVSNLRFSILEQSNITPSLILEDRDTTPPESFVPEIARDPSVFNGAYFLAFNTQDKGVGMSHYEVKETKRGFSSVFSKWREEESPYILRDQELKSRVFVKAVDNIGNEQIVEITPTNLASFYDNYSNWFIIMVTIFLMFICRNIFKNKCKNIFHH